MEKYVLLKLRVNGVKGIEKELEFNFSNSLLKRSFDNSNSHVKAIYGSNGAGKTAVIYAMRMFNQLIQTKDYISLANYDGTFKKIINQNTKKFFIETTFALIDNDSNIKDIYIQSYTVEQKKKDESYFISYESLKKLIGLNLSITNKTKLIYEVCLNKLKLNCDKEDYDIIASSCTNLLGNKSFIQIISSDVEKLYHKVKYKELFVSLGCLSLFSVNTVVVINDNDKDYISPSKFIDIFSNISKIKNEDTKMFDALIQRNKIPSSNDDIVFVKYLDRYEKEISGVTKFLKVFKTDLETIEIEKKIEGEFYHCRIILVYKDGRRIDKQFESVGVKKLIGYYDAFCNLERGGIVFIDEFDANIHDVLLTKLLEYITFYTEGQFVFTTHNLNPMHILKKQKYAIDFISNDGYVTSWKSSGNYDPASLYSKGLIDKSPFDMSPSDFIGVFENE